MAAVPLNVPRFWMDADTYKAFVETGFGSQVRLSAEGGTALIGAYNSSDAEHGPLSGAAYVFQREGGAWYEEARLTGEDTESEESIGAPPN